MNEPRKGEVRKERIKWFVWPTLLPGIGGFVAAYRALYLLAALWEWESIRYYNKKQGKVHKWVKREIKAIESEWGGGADIGEGRPMPDWQFLLSRRRTASTAWAISSAVQFALGGMIVSILSLAGCWG